VLNLFKKNGKKKVADHPVGAMYHHLTVKEIIKETNDAITIVFEDPENEIKYLPGQYITLIMNIDGEEVRRSYSLSSSPDQDTYPAVTVKKLDGGKVSSYLLNELKTGDNIKIMAPKGNFTTNFDPGLKRILVFFAGGSGITPLMSLIKSALLKEPDSRIILIYQNQKEESIIFHQAIEELSDTYPERIEVNHILSRPSDSWKGKKGRLSAEDVKGIFTSCDLLKKDFAVFTCGPQGMMETVESVLDELEIDSKKRFKESFFSTTGTASETSAAGSKSPPIASESKVTILLDNEDHEIVVKPDEYILETALDADINMPFSCQSGICTSCRGRLLSGKVSMEDPEGLSDEEIKDGYILTCVSHPASKDIKIEIG
jgi:ring-1,2-phenylacetyl-CoA epoxidase subunit PaaE